MTLTLFTTQDVTKKEQQRIEGLDDVEAIDGDVGNRYVLVSKRRVR